MILARMGDLRTWLDLGVLPPLVLRCSSGLSRPGSSTHLATFGVRFLLLGWTFTSVTRWFLAEIVCASDEFAWAVLPISADGLLRRLRSITCAATRDALRRSYSGNRGKEMVFH
jgi:hypothetical protein